MLKTSGDRRLAGYLVLVVLVVSACGEEAKLPIEAGMGPNPTLPEPNPTLIPTVSIARAVGWPAGLHPTPATGTEVNAFATGLDHPRWLCVLPNGDVLVAETNAPPRPDEEGGVMGWITRRLMARAGAGRASADRIALLRDEDRDGRAEFRSVFLSGLHSPFGMALVGGTFYVADTDAVLAVPYESGATALAVTPRKVLDLPAGPRNHHWTKNLIATADGSRLFVTVGSNSNVAENGFEAEEGRAAIWEIELATGAHRIFASGLRNPNGLAFEPLTGTLYTVVNERDELGSDLVPDYLTSVRDGGFYGWPYSYYGAHVDARVEPQRPDLVAQAVVPDYALGAHTASLGLAHSDGRTLAPLFGAGVFIGQHGSWNRRPPSGYRVLFVPFVNGRPAGKTVDVLTGFLAADGTAHGRPVGVAVDGRGGLLVADDTGNAIWRVTTAAR